MRPIHQYFHWDIHHCYQRVGLVLRHWFSMLPDQRTNWQFARMADDLDMGQRCQQCQVLHQRRVLNDVLQADQCN